MTGFSWTRRGFCRCFLLVSAASTGCLHDRPSESSGSDDDVRDADENREEPESVEPVKDEVFHVDSPYGGGVDPRSLVVEPRESGKASITVSGDEETLYHVDLDFKGEHPDRYVGGIRIGAVGDYTVTLETNEHRTEELWRVGRGYSDFVVDPFEPTMKTQEASGMFEITLAEEAPPDLEPPYLTEVNRRNPLEKLLELYKECQEDDSHEFCIHPDTEQEDPDSTAARTAFSGAEYAEALEIQEQLPHHPPPDDNYLHGYYFKHHDRLYNVIEGSRAGVRL